jgi:hypothetical protein
VNPFPPPPIVIDLEADTGEEMVLQASATVDKQQDDVKQEEDAKTLRMKKETNTILSTAEHRQSNVKLPLPSPSIVIDLEADTGEEMDLEASATVDKQQENIQQEQNTKLLQLKKATETVVSRAEHPPPRLVIDLETDTDKEMDLEKGSATVDKQQDNIKQERETKPLEMVIITKLSPPPQRMVIWSWSVVGQLLTINNIKMRILVQLT